MIGILSLLKSTVWSTILALVAFAKRCSIGAYSYSDSQDSTMLARSKATRSMIIICFRVFSLSTRTATSLHGPALFSKFHALHNYIFSLNANKPFQFSTDFMLLLTCCVRFMSVDYQLFCYFIVASDLFCEIL